MKKKRARTILITGIATVAGIFGGFKVYSSKKKKFLSIASEKTENEASTNN